MEDNERTNYEEKYFAASNSAEGFKNYYGDIFDSRKFDKLYILKGGPGTGKSRFLREVAGAAEERGFSVKYYYCSSDPDSLDGIIVGDNKIAVTDGTAPHGMDPKYPGCVDEIINLGEFWNEEKLESKREEIISLSDKKADAYRRAYRFLEAYKVVTDSGKREIRDLFSGDKMRAALDRIFKNVKSGEKFSLRPGLVDSLGMKGRVRFDTYRKKAEKNYFVLDFADSAYLLFFELINIAREKKLPTECSFSPISPEYIDAVYFPTLKVAFTVSEKRPQIYGEDKIINMARFVDSERFGKIKKRMSFASKCAAALLREAENRLEEAKNCHFALEKIYISAMDFEKKEKVTKELINKIFRSCEKT